MTETQLTNRFNNLIPLVHKFFPMMPIDDARALLINKCNIRDSYREIKEQIKLFKDNLIQ